MEDAGIEYSRLISAKQCPLICVNPLEC